MKKMLVKSALAALVGVGLTAGGALALPFNDRDPFIGSASDPFTTSGEPSLQNVLDSFTVNNDLNAVTDQSNVALWTQSGDFDSDAFRVSLYSSATNLFGIYSATSGLSYTFTDMDQNFESVSFQIYSNGLLEVTNVDGTKNYVAGFGQAFGFYVTDNTNYFYTEDDKNGDVAHALTYNLDGIEWAYTTTIPGFGDVTKTGVGDEDDWIIAFNDGGGDYDFQDAVFYVEDISQVPEPTTMLLFGTGLVGLAGISRRRKK